MQKLLSKVVAQIDRSLALILDGYLPDLSSTRLAFPKTWRKPNTGCPAWHDAAGIIDRANDEWFYRGSDVSWMSNVRYLCQICGANAEPFYYPKYSEKEQPIFAGYYCYDNAWGAGFCNSCGEFWGGIESFDFPQWHGNIKGMCDRCSFSFRDELGEFDDEEQYSYWEGY